MAIDQEQHTFRSALFQSVVQEAIHYFNATPVHALPLEGKFVGTGVYALYYRGAFEPYKKATQRNTIELLHPLYVGKAVPKGWRKARVAGGGQTELHRRLREHAKSIRHAENLQLSSFFCRFMIFGEIEQDLIVPVEAELIRQYRPWWNTIIDGFGNHDPGKGRYDQALSDWDILHPGRPWTHKVRGGGRELSEILARIKEAGNG